MSSTITVVAPRSFSDGRALPAAGKWVPTSFGFAYEARVWRITVHSSVPVDASLIPPDARTDDQRGWFSTEVTLIGDAPPAVARELFEETARRIATNTSGKAIGDAGVLMPPRMRTREPVALSTHARMSSSSVELEKAEAMLRADRNPLFVSRPWHRKAIAVFVIVAGILAIYVKCQRLERRAKSSERRHGIDAPEDQRMPFDAALWKQSGTFANSGRVKMVHDLIDRELLIGRTRDEVVTMLGKPSRPDDIDVGAVDEHDLAFRLGWYGTSMSNASIVLVVRFGDDGRATDAEIDD